MLTTLRAAETVACRPSARTSPKLLRPNAIRGQWPAPHLQAGSTVKSDSRFRSDLTAEYARWRFGAT